MTPFDIVNNINEKKGFLKDFEGGYVPYIVNRALSFQRENIFVANQMNQYSGELDPDQQYDFYYHEIPRGKRWGKWTKFVIEDDIKKIMEYFECSFKKAFEYKRILTKAQLKDIAKFLKKET